MVSCKCLNIHNINLSNSFEIIVLIKTNKLIIKQENLLFMPSLQNPKHRFEPQLSTVEIDTNKIKGTIGMLSSHDSFAPLLLSLNHIEELVDEHVNVIIQRGLGNKHNISDYKFTEFGAEIMEDEFSIITLSNVLLKYSLFSVEDIFYMKEKQIIISTTIPKMFTNEMAQYFYERKITAVGINFLNIESFQIQNIVSKLVSSIIFANNIEHIIQINPFLLKSVYCYNGDICNREIAENAGVPWKDIIELCWNWN